MCAVSEWCVCCDILGSVRTPLLCRWLEANGGRVVTSVTASEATHLLVGNKVRCSRLPVLLSGCEVPVNGTCSEGRLDQLVPNSLRDSVRGSL